MAQPLTLTHCPRPIHAPDQTLAQYVPEPKQIVDTKTYDLHARTRKRRRRSKAALGQEVLRDPSPAPLPPLTPLPSSPTPHQAEIPAGLDDSVDAQASSKQPAVYNDSSSNLRIRNSINKPQNRNSEFSTPPLNLNSADDKTAGYHQLEKSADSLQSGRASESDGSSPNEKIPKSSFRRTSSTRSALSLVFDISQNQTISRSDSFSSRCESRQGKYHTECTPVDDPSLKIENRSRLRNAQGQRTRPGTVSRPGSELSLLGRRESVTHVIYAGESNIDGEEVGWETVSWKKLQLQNNYRSRSSLTFGRMASPLRENDVTPGEFDVIVDDDYSLSRQSKVTTPTTSYSGAESASGRGGFLYQVTDFDRLSKDVPNFVRHYAQKSGKMVTESFILRLNYLRRRRALGEVSSTINIGNSNSSSNNSHSHSNASVSNASKRSSPAAS